MLNELETLDLYDLSSLLKKTAASIRTDLCRNPHRLPPRLFVPGSAKVLWLKSDVLQWLQACRKKPAVQVQPQQRPQGRPTKAEQVAARRAEAGEVLA